jgi:hypothetical protein
LSPAELASRVQLADKTRRDTVARLITTGRARRTGERGRIYAVIDDQAQTARTEDAQTTRVVDIAEQRWVFDAKRGRTVATLREWATAFVGRRCPPDLRPEAAAARECLRSVARDVQSTRDPAEFEALLLRARPLIEEAKALHEQIVRARDAIVAQTVPASPAIAVGSAGRPLPRPVAALPRRTDVETFDGFQLLPRDQRDLRACAVLDDRGRPCGGQTFEPIYRHRGAPVPMCWAHNSTIQRQTPALG